MKLIVAISMQGRLPDTYWPLAEATVASVRRYMPGTIFAQHTDYSYPRLPWADEVVRHEVKRGDIIEHRWSQMLKHMEARPDAHFMQLDCDVVLRSDVRDVFEQDFDVAMCRTPDRRDNVYNAGVIFCKNTGMAKDFWLGVLHCYSNPKIRDGWEGSQTAITQAADTMKSGGLKVLDLPFEVFNYTPDGPGVVPDTARIVHYRGQRKRFMLKEAA